MKKNETVRTKFMECVHCNKPFLAFTNILTKVEDQPCPYCYVSKSGKKWARTKDNRMIVEEELNTVS